MQTFINPAKKTWAEIVRRPQFNNEELKSTVSAILQDVKKNGDVAVKKYCLRFDSVQLE
jgi:histidinol dehydrogenase